jgi:hypothetical protein
VNFDKTSNINLLTPSNNKLTLVGDGKDELVLEYEIEREDPTKDWYALRSKHYGKVILKKIDDKDGQAVLDLRFEYTSNETRGIDNQIERKIINYLRENQCIEKNSNIEKVLFGAFTNRERVEFLLSFHGEDPLNIFSFQEITDIEISVDSYEVLPDKICYA